MAGAAQRRAVEPPQPVRSPEREALARAATAHSGAVDRLQRLRAALEGARRDSADALREVDGAAEIRDRARREEPQRAAAVALGEAFEGGPSLEQAEKAFREANDRHQHLRGVAEVLASEIPRAEEHAAATLAARRAAVAAVLDTDPAVDLLYAEYVATLAWSEALRDCFRLLGPRLPRRHQYWDRTNPELPPVEEPLPVTLWKEALAGLEAGNPDVELPAIG